MPSDTSVYYLLHELTSNLQGGNCMFVSILSSSLTTHIHSTQAQARHLSVFLVNIVDLDDLCRKIFLRYQIDSTFPSLMI